MKFLECLKSELDLESEAPIDTSNEYGNWGWYSADGLDKNQGEITIDIPANPNYIDFASCQLYTKTRIYSTDLGLTTALTDENCTVAPANNFLYSQFKQQQIEINSTVVENTPNFAYKCYMLNLLNYNNEAKNTHLATCLFVNDTSSKMEVINTKRFKTVKQQSGESQAQSTSTEVEQDVNEGFLKRRQILLDGKGVLEMVGPIYSDLFNSDRLMLNNTPIRIKLHKNDETFCLMGPENHKYKIYFEEVKVRVRHQQLSPAAIMAHTKLLQSSNAIYPIKETFVKRITIKNSTLQVQTEITKGTLPEKIIIGMTESLSASGKFDKNPFNYQHFYPKSVKLRVNQLENPYLNSLNLDFENNIFYNGYMTLFDTLDKHDMGISITPFDYKNGYTLYGFNLMPITSCGGDYKTLLKSGLVNHDIEFHQKSIQANANQEIDLICLLVYDSKIEIDSDRKPFKLQIIP